MKKDSALEALIYAHGIGLQQQFAFETIIMAILRETKENDYEYVKVKDLNILSKPYGTDKKYAYYHFDHPNGDGKIVVQILLHNGKISIKSEKAGEDYEDLEQTVIDFVQDQIKINNLSVVTNTKEEFQINMINQTL